MIKKYRGYIFRYGILTVLYMLEHYENVENYDECKNIVDAIKSLEYELGIDLATRFSDDVVREVVEVYRNAFNLTGRNAEENSRYYAECLINGEVI